MSDEITNELSPKTLWTLADVWRLSGYGTTATTYQELRRRNVHPVAKRKNPVKGGPIGLYDPAQVMEALHTRIKAQKLKRKAQQ